MVGPAVRSTKIETRRFRPPGGESAGGPAPGLRRGLVGRNPGRRRGPAVSGRKRTVHFLYVWTVNPPIARGCGPPYPLPFARFQKNFTFFFKCLSTRTSKSRFSK